MDGTTPQMQHAVAGQPWKMGASVEAAFDWAKDHGVRLKAVRVDIAL